LASLSNCTPEATQYDYSSIQTAWVAFNTIVCNSTQGPSTQGPPTQGPPTQGPSTGATTTGSGTSTTGSSTTGRSTTADIVNEAPFHLKYLIVLFSLFVVFL